MASPKTSVHTTIPRFTVQDGHEVFFMDVLDTGRLAVAGYNDTTECSFIDLFMLQLDPDSQEKPLLLTSEPYYSEEFTEFGSEWRSVCLLDDRLFLTCCKNTIALYDSSNGGLVKQGKVNGKARCMTTRDGLVYVGLYVSNEVIVLDARELRIKKTITLKGLVEGDYLYPRDITVSNNKLFICTVWSRRALMCNSEGEIEHEYTNTQYSRAYSLTVSEEKGLKFILWGNVGKGRQVVVYLLSGGHSSISGGHSSISGGHSSISGGHILASFKVPDDSWRIRINNNMNRLFVVTGTTGEVYEYHTSDILFDSLTSLELLIEKNECKTLLDYFEVPAKKSKDIIKSNTPFSSLVHYLREAGKVYFDDINYLMTACSDKGLSKLMAVLTIYQQAKDSKFTKTILKDQLKALEDKRHELSQKLIESEDEKHQLTGRLNTTEEEKQKLKDTLTATEGERQQLRYTLKTTEEERQQLTGRLKKTEEERQQLKDTLKATEEERQQLTGRLKTTREERLQFKDALKATEEERQQLRDTLKATEEERQQLTGRLKTTEEERLQLKDALKVTEEERQQLTGRLKTTEEERQQFKDTLKATDKDFRHTLNTAENKLKTLKNEKEELLQQQKEELEEAKSSLRATKDELVKYQLEYAKESMALQEVLKQTREALNQQELASNASVTGEENVTSDISQESTLAADYGRLMVNVADNLTLDSTLKLAILFGLPPAETDMLRRVSLIETPGTL